jgi:hypothetical protein
MFTIIETLWRLVCLVACAFIQAIAAILGGIALLFGKGSEFLRTSTNKIFKKLDEGKVEAKLREIAAK